MTTDQTTTARLDVPLAKLRAEIDTGVLRGAAARSNSPSDQLAYALDVALVEHPDCCSTEADYPGWTPAHATAVTV